MSEMGMVPFVHKIFGMDVNNDKAKQKKIMLMVIIWEG
jgi:hypothetical protein